MLQERVPMWWDAADLSGLNNIWDSGPASGLVHNPLEILIPMQDYGYEE